MLKKNKPWINNTNGKWSVTFPRTYVNGRKNISAKTKEELDQKFAKEEEKVLEALRDLKPKSLKLNKYIEHYFMYLIGLLPSTQIKQKRDIAQKIIYGSEIDCDIRKLSVEDINHFIKLLSNNFMNKKILASATDIIKDTFELSNYYGVTKLDTSKIVSVSDLENDYASNPKSCYIMSESEYKKILDYCLKMDLIKDYANLRALILALYTGQHFSRIVNFKYTDFQISKKPYYLSFYSTKNEKIIKEPLSDSCVEWLKAKIAHGDLNAPYESDNANDTSISRYTYDETKPLILTRNGSIILPQSISRYLYGILKSLLLPDGITSTTIQLAYIKILLDHGTQLKDIAQMFDRDSWSLRETILSKELFKEIKKNN